MATTIELYGDIQSSDLNYPSWLFEDGEEGDDYESFCLNDFMSAYKAAGNDDLIIKISSDGGDFKTGIDIYNVLKNHPAKVTTICMGTALSAAALIMQAGNTRLISNAAVMMAHQASSLFCGSLNSETCLDMAEMFDSYDNVNYAVFSEKTQNTVSDLKEKFKGSGYWLTPEKALAEGFVDAIDFNMAQPVLMKNSARRLQNRYHAPAAIQKVLNLNSLRGKSDMALSPDDKKMIAEISAESTAQVVNAALKEPLQKMAELFAAQAEDNAKKVEAKTTEELIAAALEPVLAQNAQLKAELDTLKTSPVNNTGSHSVPGLQNPKKQLTFGI